MPSDLSDLTFHEFKSLQGQPTPWLWVPELLLALIAVFGILANTSVVYVTFRCKTLRGTCNWLLTATCIGEVIHQVSHFPGLWISTFGGNFIEYGLCLKIQLVPLFAIGFIQPSLTAIAGDRFFAAYSPIFYKWANETGRRSFVYVLFVLVPVFAAAFAFIAIMYTHGIDYSMSMTTCDTGEVFKSELFTYFTYDVLLFNGCSVIVYILIWFTLRINLQNASSTASALAVQTKLLKSLAMIVSVNIGGYLLNIGLMEIYLTTIPPSQPLLIWSLFQVNATILNICAAVNAPILYWMSSEYRKAYNKWVFGWFKKSDPSSAGGAIQMFTIYQNHQRHVLYNHQGVSTTSRVAIRAPKTTTRISNI